MDTQPEVQPDENMAGEDPALVDSLHNIHQAKIDEVLRRNLRSREKTTLLEHLR